jgi:hypothetical protein
MPCMSIYVIHANSCQFMSIHAAPILLPVHIVTSHCNCLALVTAGICWLFPYLIPILSLGYVLVDWFVNHNFVNLVTTAGHILVNTVQFNFFVVTLITFYLIGHILVNCFTSNTNFVTWVKSRYILDDCSHFGKMVQI